MAIDKNIFEFLMDKVDNKEYVIVDKSLSPVFRVNGSRHIALVNKGNYFGLFPRYYVQYFEDYDIKKQQKISIIQSFIYHKKYLKAMEIEKDDIMEVFPGSYMEKELKEIKESKPLETKRKM